MRLTARQLLSRARTHGVLPKVAKAIAERHAGRGYTRGVRVYRCAPVDDRTVALSWRSGRGESVELEVSDLVLLREMKRHLANGG